jgi:uncharacterized protein YjdB
MVRSSLIRSIARFATLLGFVVGCDQQQPVDPGNRPDAGRFIVSITPERDSVDVGATVPLSAKVVDALGAVRTDQAVHWSSLAPAIASVDGIGLVTGVAVGTASVVATVGAGAQAHADTAAILVQAGTPALRIAPEIAEITLGDSLHFEATVSASSGASVRGLNVEWSTSDQAIAPISSDGVVASLQVGDVQLTATVNGMTAIALARVVPNPVVSLSVAPANSGLYPGETVQLIATTLDGRGRLRQTKNALWTSSAPAVARVTTDGVVTGVAQGSALITASIDGRTASATVTVFAVAGARVSVTAPSNSIPLGGRMQAVATVYDAQGNVLTGKAVAWSSSNPAVAQVASNGMITGLVVGSTTINAISDSKVGTLPISVVNATASSLAIIPTTATLSLGSTAQLVAEVRDQGGNVLPSPITWSSAEPGIASVSSSGLVSALRVGTVAIGATSGGMNAQATITVTSTAVASVTVSPSNTQLQIGGTQQLSVSVTSATGSLVPNAAIAWSSSNPAAVTVSATGRATGVSAGSATITATSASSSGSAVVAVAAPAPVVVASVAVIFNSPSIGVGQSMQANAVARDASGTVINGRAVTWLSQDPTLASVSATGLVTGIAGGSATIAAQVDGVIGFATVQITAPTPLPVYSVQLTLAPSAIFTGQQATANVVLRDSLGGTLVGHTIGYSSSKPSVASVGLGGLVTGVAPGGVTITASSGGKSGAAPLTVTGVAVPSVASVSVTAGTTSLTPGQTTQATATARDSAGNVLLGQTVTWVSSNPAAATVSASGLITGLAGGASTVTASAGGKGGSLVISVSNPATASVTVSAASTSLTVGQVVQATGTAKDANGNVLPGATIFWSSSNAAVATVSMTGLITGISAGTANISGSNSGKSGSVAITVSPAPPSGAVPSIAPALPRIVPSTTWPNISRTLTVNAGGNLQAALDSARRGDEIVIAAGATFVGNFQAKPKPGTGGIVVRTSALGSLPPLGTRVRPTDAQYMPKILTPNNLAAMAVLPGASGWRFVGLEVTEVATITVIQYRKFWVGDGTAGPAPFDVVLDRIFVHGQPNVNSAGCVLLNSAATAVIDSWLSDCHGKGVDAQAIGGWNGPGPYLIENNQLEASGENIIFGGADPAIPNLIPSDITIRRNFITKPLSWKPAAPAGGIGTWTVKNLFELKNAQRVLFEQNVLENNWVDGQTGSAVMLYSVNQSGGCPWCITQDVTFQWNHINNSAAAFNLSYRWPGQPAPSMRRVKVAHNLLTNIGAAGLGAAMSARVFLLQNDVDDLWIENNTGFAPYSYVAHECVLKRTRFTFRNNIGGAATYNWFNTAGQGDAANAACFTSPYLVANNGFVTSTPTLVPSGSIIMSSIASIGFANPTWPSGNWTSPIPGMGVDFPTLQQKLLGVR